MDTFILYLLKVNFAFAILYLFYKLAFTKDTFFNLRRFVLLAICVISIVYPFVEISSFKTNTSEDNLLYNVYTAFIPEIVISNNNADSVTGATVAFGWIQMLILLYISGIVLLFFRSTLEFRNIYKTIRNSVKREINGITVHVNSAPQETYSFLKWISLSPEQYSDSELNEILIHEQTHVREWHSLDILLIQFILIINWFNPFIWLLRSEIRMNHEYLADRRVIFSGFNKKDYQYHLIGLGSVNEMAAAKLYNNFSVLPLKNRLKMLNKKRTSNIMISKYLMFIPVLVFLLVLSNCTDSKQEAEKEYGADMDELVVVGYGSGKAAEPYRETEDFVIDKIYEVADVMPEFPGGQSGLMQFLAKNIKYPVEAQDKGIQGRVALQFVVEKDGSINEVNVMKSVDETLDNEAIRVIKTMPKWTPGKNKDEYVRVSYVVPVVFRLQ